MVFDAHHYDNFQISSRSFNIAFRKSQLFVFFSDNCEKLAVPNLTQKAEAENVLTQIRVVCLVRCLAWIRSSAITEGPRDASCQLKSCQLPRNSAETTYTTSPDQIDGMKLEI